MYRSKWQRRLMFAFLLSVTALTQEHAAQSPKPLGKLYDLGGYKLHLYCTGQGKPAVVLSIGSGDFSFDWLPVQQRVSSFTRVCSYDRGGEAWSDLGPNPHTHRQEAYDLRRLLKAAGVDGPFVMVGQSMGGTIIREFARQNPQEVAGMILVDAGHEDSHFLNPKGLFRERDTSKGRPIPPLRDTVGPQDQLSPETIAQIQASIKQMDFKPEIEPPFDKLPADAQKLRLWALGLLPHFAATYNDFAGEEAADAYEWKQAHPRPFGDIPLIVLTRSENNYPPKFAKQLTEEHEQQQADLATLSTNAKHILVPNSGHHIQVDQPQAVADAIREIVKQARKNGMKGIAPLRSSN
jgi:pimeloyl-ACP methyl ester carboxylesterase